MPISKLRRYYERVCQMNAYELIDRGQQALAKRSDAALARLGYPFDKQPTRRTTSVAPGFFFFESAAVDSILTLIKQRLPGRAERIVQEADGILQHNFKLLGYDSLNFSAPSGTVDWHWDPVHDKRSPRKSFHRVRYLDHEECGDAKIIWELNRHQHLVTLAKAYRLTGEQRYVETIIRQKQHWQSDNPYPIGINWASSLEVAFRSLSWLWTYHLLHGSSDLSDRRDEWLHGLSLHGRHIERYLSTYFSPNTHLLGEGVALFFLGVLCPELRTAERWKSLGWNIVLQEAARQVREDGFHFEQSTYYHVYALDLFLHAALLARANGISPPKELERTVEKMLNALCLLGRNGPPPQLGDDDGGRLFDPHRNRADNLLDPLATGAILFRRGDFKTVAGIVTEEALWLHGEKGAELWDNLDEFAVGHEPAALPQAGYYLLAAERTQLIVDAGPIGAHSGGHGHADALSVSLQSHGHSILIDCGTAVYIDPNGDRDSFRGTSRHNTLCVDGLNQAETAAAFSWKELPKSHVEQWIQGNSLDVLVARHEGYHRLPLPVTHRRWVVSLKNGTYLVRDVIAGSGRHRLDISWHLAPELEVVEDFIFQAPGAGHGIGFFQAGSPGWNPRLQTTMWSPVYGCKSPTTSLIFSAEIMLPAESVMLLVPIQGLRAGKCSFKAIEHTQFSNVSVYECVIDEIEHSFVFNESGDAWHAASLSSDANFVCHTRNTKSSDVRLTFCKGSYATGFAGAEVCCSRAVIWAELVMNDRGRTLSSSDNSAICTNLQVDPISAACGEA